MRTVRNPGSRSIRNVIVGGNPQAVGARADEGRQIRGPQLYVALPHTQRFAIGEVEKVPRPQDTPGEERRRIIQDGDVDVVFVHGRDEGARDAQLSVVAHPPVREVGAVEQHRDVDVAFPVLATCRVAPEEKADTTPRDPSFSKCFRAAWAIMARTYPFLRAGDIMTILSPFERRRPAQRGYCFDPF